MILNIANVHLMDKICQISRDKDISPQAVIIDILENELLFGYDTNLDFLDL